MEADAIYDFSASADDELGFKKGAFLKILCVEDDPNWYLAEQNGRTGLVPCNYISMRPHDWYVRHCSRLEAEERLLEIDPATNSHLQRDGAFLLRRSEADGKGFSLSVKQANEVLHFKVLQDDAGKYFFWLSKFDSINQLIEHHRRTSISRNRMLLLVDRVPSKLYPASGRENEVKRVIARFDFTSEDAEELSFHRGDVIEVTGQENENWWRGRMPGGRTGLFPSNYVDLLPSVS
ncbi:GRB2 adaptor protein a [Fasciola hepatica]|uniref:GRB2 adaptor protein a n=2 Tax=Fasciola TaxID=6191 RepID=A0A4E0RGN7_FASHE|nr:GRB2 adaptor protein a [Fasciola hepatica]